MEMQLTDDPEQASRTLGEWLGGVLDVPELRVENLVTPQGGGFSAQTLLFEAVWPEGGAEHREAMVARVAPQGPGLFPTYDLVAEARVITALAENTDVPVADVVGVEADASVLGAQFLVMRRTPGRVPLDDPPWTLSGWVVDLPVEGRERIFDEFIRVLVAIQEVDWKRLGLRFLDRPEEGDTPLEQHLSLLERYYDFASDNARDSELINQGLAWIHEHRPREEEPTVLSWGDSQPHNVIYADDLSAAAALDWEMMQLASPELDLGCLTFCMRLYTEGMSIPLIEGFPDRDAIVAKYEAVSGRKTRHLDYYEVLNAVRSAMVLMRLGRLLIMAGVLPPDHTMPIANPASKVLAGMLGVEGPEFAAQGLW